MTTPAPVPDVGGFHVMFYYRDLAKAALWYETVLGFERRRTLPHAVLFRVAGNGHLVLVDAEGGSQRPIAGPHKGAILSLETRDLAGWGDRLMAAGALPAGTHPETGAGGVTREFKVRDPEGYVVEFFEWMD